MSVVMEKPTVNNINNLKVHTSIHRSEIWMADISGEGAVQFGQRPVVVIQNDIGNRFSPTVIVAPISSSTTKKKIPTHVELNAARTGLLVDSIILMEQVRVIDQWCLMYKIGKVDDGTMDKANKALAISLGLDFLYDK